MGNEGLTILCLQFMDNTLFFKDASMQNILTLKSILHYFELASGLRVNFYKSNIAGLAVEKRMLQLFVHTLSCNMMKSPFTYIGLPEDANPRSLNTWQHVIEKIKKRLSSWRQR